MPDQINKTILQFELDRARNKEALSAVTALQRSLTDIGGAAAKSTTTIQNLNKAMEGLKRQGAIDDVVKQFSQLVKTEKQAIEAANDLRKSLSDVGATKDEINDAVRSFHELTSAGGGAGGGGKGLTVEGLRRTGGALSQLGLGDIGGGISRIGDIAQIGKEFQALGESAQAGLAAAGVGMGEVIAVAGPLALAAGGIALAFKQLIDTIEEGRKAVEKAENDLVNYYKLVESSTSKDIQQKISEQRAIQSANAQALGVSQKPLIGNLNDALKDASPEMAKAITEGIQAYIKSGGKDQAGQTALANLQTHGNIAALPGLNSLIEQMTKLSSASNDAQAQIDKYNNALKSNQVQANDAAQAFLDFQKMSRGSSQAVKDRVQDLKDEQGALKIQIAYLQASGDTSEATSKKLQDLTKQYDDDGASIDNLTKTILPLTQVREKEEQNVKDFQKALEDATSANQKATEDLKNAAKKRDEDIQKIEEDSLQKRADLAKDYADKQVEITEKAVQAASDSLKALQRKRTDLLTQLGRDEEKVQRSEAFKNVELQIKERRQERDDLKAHLEAMRDIQRQYASDEREAVIDRNFEQLFKLQERKNDDLAKENTKYTDQQQSRAQALQDEQNDLQRQRAFEKQERLIAYNNQLADAQLAYQRELEMQATAKQRELNIAQQAYQRQLSLAAQAENRLLQLRQQAYNREIEMVRATEEAKLKIFRNTLTRIYGSGDAVYNGTRSPSTSRITRFADGGLMSAGSPGLVNDKFPGQRESFGGAMFPPGLGVFIPVRSGNVDSGKSAGATVTITQNISAPSGNAVEIGQMVRTQTLQAIKQGLGLN